MTAPNTLPLPTVRDIFAARAVTPPPAGEVVEAARPIVEAWERLERAWKEGGYVQSPSMPMLAFNATVGQMRALCAALRAGGAA